MQNTQIFIDEVKSFYSIPDLEKEIRENGYEEYYLLQNELYAISKYDSKGNKIVYSSEDAQKEIVAINSNRYENGVGDTKLHERKIKVPASNPSQSNQESEKTKNTKNLVIIVGQSGSGKTTLAKKMEQKDDWSSIVSATTRKPRENEKNGIDYIFLNQKDFDEADKIESVVFAGNSYGILACEFKKFNFYNNLVVVAEPNGAKQLAKYAGENEDYNINTKIVFLDIPEHIRIENMKRRGDVSINILNRLQQEPNFKEILEDLKKTPDIIISSLDDITVNNVLSQLHPLPKNVDLSIKDTPHQSRKFG